jgi:hypothetical protein
MLRLLKSTEPEISDRITAYLRTITGNINLVGTTSIGPYEIINFEVDRGDKPPLEFDASGMSDGTLRTRVLITTHSPSFRRLCQRLDPLRSQNADNWPSGD